MNEVILDTDIWSEILKGNNQHVRSHAARYRLYYDHLTLSTITLMEIVSGLRRTDNKHTIQLISEAMQNEKLRILSFDKACAFLAGEIYASLERAGQRIGYPDTMIAATAIVYGLPLVTGNQRHYQRIVAQGYDLQLDNWRI
ncbi:MAG: PIN domain-containing protein [Anaerolineales bacterium]|nr:PIN domain-containing protein [Anaerolineales bacterium]